MDRESIMRLPSMPPAAPSYPRGPFRFIDREYLIIDYESEPEAIRAALPEPLEPAPGNKVSYEFIRMPDSSGFGDYTESGLVVPALLDGEAVSFVAQMYLDDEPPTSGGREIWGFPKKYASPRLVVHGDTLTGTLYYADERVAMGTMAFKHEALAGGFAAAEQAIVKTQIFLKLIPDVDFSPAICQLVAFNITEVTIKGAWQGRARLHLIPHVNAPVADLPVRRCLGGRHFLADLTLGPGRVAHDYLKR